MYMTYYPGSVIGPILGFIFMLVIIAFVVWAFVFWIKTIIHLMNSKKEGTEKIAWIILILSINIIGSIIYYYLVIKPENKTLRDIKDNQADKK